MAQEAIWVEKRAGKEAVPVLAENELEAVQMSGQDEVVAKKARGLPDFRIVSAQDADVTEVFTDGRRSLRAGDGDHAPRMRHARHLVVNPSPPTAHHGVTDAVHADLTVVVATDGKHRCDVSEFPNQVIQLAQLGGVVDEVAPEQHQVRIGAKSGINDVPGQRVGTSVPEVNVADVQEAARVRPRRQSFFADIEGLTKSHLQRSTRPSESTTEERERGLARDRRTHR